MDGSSKKGGGGGGGGKGTKKSMRPSEVKSL